MNLCSITLCLTLVAQLLPEAETTKSTEEPSGVSAILLKHDKTLVKELAAYVVANPKAKDIEQAYLALFDKAIEHDWFLEHERIAQSYLREYPEGSSRPLAQIISVMARATDGKFADGLVVFKTLMSKLEGPDQEEFAAQFTETFATAATLAGEYDIARQAYRALLSQYRENPKLTDKINDDLAKLDMVGKPAPKLVVKDLGETALRIDDFKGKYVIIDFWATWCAPCLNELPNLEAAYAKYHTKGFEIVSVSLDETRQSVVDFVKAKKIPWRQIHNASSGGDMVDRYGISSIPATFLIDPKGEIIKIDLRGEALEKTLAKLMK